MIFALKTFFVNSTKIMAHEESSDVRWGIFIRQSYFPIFNCLKPETYSEHGSGSKSLLHRDPDLDPQK